MSKTKLHEILKKYRILAQKHKDSWDTCKKRTAVKYAEDSYDYMLEGNKLFESLIQDLEGIDVFKL
jgi:hypothetical protein